jgi:hypothetical protein
MRAILDLGAANTPSLAAAAVNAANFLLAAPAPVVSTSTSPAPPPVAEPPLPFRRITADIISGHLVFPTPRIPRAVAQHSPREDPLTLAPTAHDPERPPSMRLSSPSPPLSARTPRTPDTTLVLRRATDRRGRAPLPEPEALRWACKHRNCASIRPPPAEPDLSFRRSATPDHGSTTTSQPDSRHLGAVDRSTPPWRRLALDARSFTD